MPTNEETEAGVQRSAEYWGWEEVSNPDIIEPLIDADCLEGDKMISLSQIPKPFPLEPAFDKFIAYPLPVPERPLTPSGLRIVESDSDRAFRMHDAKALVVAVGPHDKEFPFPEVGDVVIVSPQGGRHTLVKGVKYLIYHRMDYLVKVTGDVYLTDQEAKEHARILPDRNQILDDAKESAPPPDIIMPGGQGGDA